MSSASNLVRLASFGLGHANLFAITEHNNMYFLTSFHRRHFSRSPGTRVHMIIDEEVDGLGREMKNDKFC